MQRGDKAPEPSMEEILASIRKIIAEEPIGSRPGPVPGGDDSDAAAAREPFPGFGPQDRDGPSPFAKPGPAAKPARPAESMPFSSLTDPVAKNVRRTEPPETKVPPPEPKAADADQRPRPSWLFAKPTGIPPPPMEPGATPSRIVQPLPGAPEKPLPAGPAALDATNKVAFPPSPFLRPGAKSDPGIARGSGFDGAPAAPEAGDGLPPLGAEETSEEPAEIGGPPEGALSNLADEEIAPAAPLPSAGPKAATERLGPLHARSPGDGAFEPKPAVADPVAVPPKAAVPSPSPAAVPGFPPLAQGLAGGGETPRGRRDADAEARPVAAPAPAAAAPKSAVEPADPLPAPKSTSAGEPAALRTLEDTVADLLRPMLRDWLDANMPRIVEKALRVELAGTIKPPRNGNSH